MQYLANLPVSDKNNFKNVECNFTKGFPLKQVYPKDENQKYIFIKHDNEDPILRQLIRQREKLDNPKNKGKKTIVDFLNRKRDFSEISGSKSNNNSTHSNNLDYPSSSKIIPSSSSGSRNSSAPREKNMPKRKKVKTEKK